jgi:hypothetical protein
MLRDARGTIAVSSLGWVDHSSLWVFRVRDGVEGSVPLGDAKHLSLHAGDRDLFSVVHHHDGDRVEVTVHGFAEPHAALARAVVGPGEACLAGDASSWAHVPTNYVAFYAGASWSDYALIRIEPREATVRLQRFAWFTNDYDKDYQGIAGVVEVPGTDQLIVSVQRDSRPVLYDPVGRRKLGTVNLAGRGGNPTLFFRRHATELWADDYDTILKLEAGTWRLLKSRRLQPAAVGTGQFIGRFWLDAEETTCVVARPFMRDVVALDTDTLRMRSRCSLDGQPLEAVGLADGLVVARDWKSGRLLRGRLHRVSRWRRW